MLLTFLAVQECCWLMPSSLSPPQGIYADLLPSQEGHPKPILLWGGVSPLPSCRTCFSLLNFTRYLLAHPSSLWSLGSCVPTGLSIVPPNLMPSENLVRPHSIACSRSLIKTLNRTYLVVHPSRLCCLNMDMWIVWETASCYKVNDIHTSPHSPLPCAVTRVSRFSFSQTL